MQEEARTQTDAQGAFVLNMNDAQAQYVIRVLHQGVNYDQSVTDTTPLELNVFDAVPKIPGLSASKGFIEVESSENILKVREEFIIANHSTPPVTQSSPHNFEISVPEDATVELAGVKGPGGIWVKISPTAAPGRKDLFRVNFPLRPGETLFQFKFELPYTGRATFRLKLPYPTQGIGVVQPASMSFKALLPGTFNPPIVANGLRMEKVVAEPVIGEVPPFEISGLGKAPASASAAQTAPSIASAPPSASAGHPGPGNAPAATQTSRKELWFMLSGIVVILALGAFALWRVRRDASPRVARNESALDGLKGELFQLESDRLRGKVSAEEYAATKDALNRSIQRLLKQS